MPPILATAIRTMANRENESRREDGSSAMDGRVEEAGKAGGGFAVRPTPVVASAPRENVVPLAVERVEFGAGRMTLLVRMAPGGQFTTPQLLQQLIPRYPDLPHHTCVNDEGPGFRAVMDHTSVAHLLEHLIISQQLRLLPAAEPAPVLCGATTWVSRTEGRARIEVSFVDDLVALQALHNALSDLSTSISE